MTATAFLLLAVVALAVRAVEGLRAIDSGQATRSRTAVSGFPRPPISGHRRSWLAGVGLESLTKLREWPAGMPKRPEVAGAWPEHPSEQVIAVVYPYRGRLRLRRRRA